MTQQPPKLRALPPNMKHDDQIKERLKDMAQVLDSAGLNEMESLMLAQILNQLVLLWCLEGLDVKTQITADSDLVLKVP